MIERRFLLGWVGLLLLAFITVAAHGQANERNQQSKKSYQAKIMSVDDQRDGCVDRKVFISINAIGGGSLMIECDRRCLGEPSWLITLQPPDPKAKVHPERSAVAAALLLAIDALHKESTSPVKSVTLEPTTMPPEFARDLCQAVSAQMQQDRFKVRRFTDPRLKTMVRKAYRDMDYVRYIKSRIEEEGFEVSVDVAENCCFQASAEGKNWKTLVADPSVGMNLFSATCCLELKSKNRP